MYKVEYDNNVYTVEYDNKVYKVEYDNNVYKVENDINMYVGHPIKNETFSIVQWIYMLDLWNLVQR